MVDPVPYNSAGIHARSLAVLLIASSRKTYNLRSLESHNQNLIYGAAGHTEVAGVLISRGAAVDYQDKVRQLCMIHIITVDIVKNNMIIGT